MTRPLRRTFPRKMRLTHSREFSAVYNHGVRRSAGPLTVIALRNGLPYNRLGLSVGRRFGGAVARSRLKRCLRESFRLLQHELPTGYDIVLVTRPHDPLPQAEYERLLRSAVERADRAAEDRPAKPRDEESTDDGASTT